MFRGSGGVRKLSPEHWLLLFVLGMAGFLEGYDTFLFTIVLPQIRATFGLTQSAASAWLSLLFLGSIPVVFITRYADIRGRRRLLLACLVGYSAFTAVTALAPSMAFFVYAQFLARLFLNAEYALAWTMVAEELPAGSRGFGFGWLATLSAVGGSMASLLYGVVFTPLGVSWRWLYFLALPPLTVVWFLRRGLPESSMYLKAKRAGRLAQHWHQILERPHRKWLLLVGFTDMLFALAVIADVFMVDYMETNRGLSPTKANLILVFGGILAIPAALAAGSLSDRYGRKLVGCLFASLNVFGVVGFFALARGPVQLAGYLVLAMLGQFGEWPTLDAYYAELFPTELRAFAGSAATLWRVPGEFLSMLLGSILIAATRHVSTAVLVLAVGPVIGIAVTWWFFPETRGTDLSIVAGAREEPPASRTTHRRRAAG